MSRSHFFRCLFVITAALLITVEGRAESRRPNVVLLVADDMRPDVIATLGNRHIRTPNLDWLVSQGTTFTRAVAPFPLCVPSRAELLTGCCSLRIPSLATGQIDPKLTTWPAAMRAAGYRTWYVGKWHTQGRPSTRGFLETRGLFAAGGGKWWQDQVDHNGRAVTGYKGWVFQNDAGEMQPDLGVGLTPDISRRFADAAISLIEQPPREPFFLQVSFTAPHDPLMMPPGYENQYDPRCIPLPANFLPEHPFDHGNARGRDELLLPFPRTPTDVRSELAVYYAVIEHLDEQLGRVFRSLRNSSRWQDTIVIFTADHGLAIGSHGLRGKQNMYEHTIGVPLIVCGPGLPRGVFSTAPIYLRDLFPTVCALAGVEIPNSVEARSQAAVLHGQTARVHGDVFGYFQDSQRMIRTDRWKLIHYPRIDRQQLFDLCADPNETCDLSADARCSRILGELRGKLDAWRRSAADPTLDNVSGK